MNGVRAAVREALAAERVSSARRWEALGDHELAFDFAEAADDSRFGRFSAAPPASQAPARRSVKELIVQFLEEQL